MVTIARDTHEWKQFLSDVTQSSQPARQPVCLARFTAVVPRGASDVNERVWANYPNP
jgi:hypothetical protein